MDRRVTFGDLRGLLVECGFERVPTKEPYVVWEHRDSGVLQAFRRHRTNERADPMTIASVRKSLVANGFMEQEEFENALHESADDRIGRAKRR